MTEISIHAPREGSDFRHVVCAGGFIISIHAPREGSDWFHAFDFCFRAISIHAPREGSDALLLENLFDHLSISIHAPREGSDSAGIPGEAAGPDFNPRSP